MGRQFEALISEAPGFLSRRNAIALIAMAAGSVATFQPAMAATGVSIVGTVFATAGGNGDLEYSIDGGVAMVVEIVSTDTPDQIATKIIAAATGAADPITAYVNEGGGITIEATSTSVLDITLAGAGITLAAIGLDVDLTPGSPATPEAFRPFSVGDGDDDLKVAVLMADAAELEEAVFVDKLAEVKAAKIIVAEAARVEAITALAKQNIEVR